MGLWGELLVVVGHPDYITSKTGIYRDIFDMGFWGELLVVAWDPGYITSKTGIYRDICDMRL